MSIDTVLQERVLRERFDWAAAALQMAEESLRDFLFTKSVTEIEIAFQELWGQNDDWGRLFRRSHLKTATRSSKGQIQNVCKFKLQQFGESPSCYTFHLELLEDSAVLVTMYVKAQAFCKWDAKPFIQAVANSIDRTILFKQLPLSERRESELRDDRFRVAIVPQQFDLLEGNIIS